MTKAKPADRDSGHLAHGTGEPASLACLDARRIVPPIAPNQKVDQLAERVEHAENRQEALLDEGVEESFPASDPVSVERIN